MLEEGVLFRQETELLNLLIFQQSRRKEEPGYSLLIL